MSTKNKSFQLDVQQKVYDNLHEAISQKAGKFASIIPTAATSIFFITPYPSRLNTEFSNIVVMTEDCTQQLLLSVKLDEATIVAYQVSSSNRDALIRHLLGTSDEASAARIFFISDTHSDATCTEVYTATLVHYKKFHRHVRSIHLIERFQGDKQTGAQSGLVYTVGIGMRKEAANKDLATTISWAHDPFKEVWVCHKSALTSNVMKGIVRLPTVTNASMSQRSSPEGISFFLDLASPDRVAMSFELCPNSMPKMLCTCQDLENIYRSLLISSRQNGYSDCQRKPAMLPYLLSPKGESIPTKIHHRTFTFFNLSGHPQVNTALLKSTFHDLGIQYYLLKKRHLFVYAAGTDIERLRLELIPKGIRLPFGFKEGCWQICFESNSVAGQWTARATLGSSISVEPVQVVDDGTLSLFANQPDLQFVELLQTRFQAEDIFLTEVHTDGAHNVPIVAFSIPKILNINIPHSFADRKGVSRTIKFRDPPGKEFKESATIFTKESQIDHWKNVVRNKSSTDSRVSCIVPAEKNKLSMQRYHCCTHDTINTDTRQLLVTLIDESFSFVMIPESITGSDYGDILNHIATSRGGLQHHSYLHNYLGWKMEYNLTFEEAGEGIYHLRLPPTSLVPVLQPRQEAGIWLIPESNPICVQVYADADLIVIVPPEAKLSDLFYCEDLPDIQIIRHQALPLSNSNFPNMQSSASKRSSLRVNSQSSREKKLTSEGNVAPPSPASCAPEGNCGQPATGQTGEPSQPKPGSTPRTVIDSPSQDTLASLQIQLETVKGEKEQLRKRLDQQEQNSRDQQHKLKQQYSVFQEEISQLRQQLQETKQNSVPSPPVQVPFVSEAQKKLEQQVQELKENINNREAQSQQKQERSERTIIEQKRLIDELNAQISQLTLLQQQRITQPNQQSSEQKSNNASPQATEMPPKQNVAELAHPKDPITDPLNSVGEAQGDINKSWRPATDGLRVPRNPARVSKAADGLAPASSTAPSKETRTPGGSNPHRNSASKTRKRHSRPEGTNPKKLFRKAAMATTAADTPNGPPEQTRPSDGVGVPLPQDSENDMGNSDPISDPDSPLNHDPIEDQPDYPHLPAASQATTQLIIDELSKWPENEDDAAMEALLPGPSTDDLTTPAAGDREVILGNERPAQPAWDEASKANAVYSLPPESTQLLSTSFNAGPVDAAQIPIPIEVNSDDEIENNNTIILPKLDVTSSNPNPRSTGLGQQPPFQLQKKTSPDATIRNKQAELILQHLYHTDAFLKEVVQDERITKKAAALLAYLPEISCYFVSALRILSSGDWTADATLPMDPHIRQLALVAIGHGWTLAKPMAYPSFTKFHLAIAMASCMGIDHTDIEGVEPVLNEIIALLPSNYKERFATVVQSKCKKCSTVSAFDAVYFYSTLSTVDSQPLCDIATKHTPDKEFLRDPAECCWEAAQFCVLKEASIKIVLLQPQCGKPVAAANCLQFLQQPSFETQGQKWQLTMLLIWRMSGTKHFYTVAAPISPSDGSDIVLHDNATGFSPALASTLPASDVISGFVFTTGEYASDWSMISPPANVDQGNQHELRTEPRQTVLGWGPVVTTRSTRPAPTEVSQSNRAPTLSYGLISLFDGCGSTYQLFTEKLGRPDVFLAAESQNDLRHVVADCLGLNVHSKWQLSKDGSKSLYLDDVDHIFANSGKHLQEFLTLLPLNAKVFVIAGSPCTDLTNAGIDKGRLGVTGPASCLFFTVYLTIQKLLTVLPDTHVRFLVENAGSMLDPHKKFIQACLGCSPLLSDTAITWCASAISPAKRRRFFFPESPIVRTAASQA